MKELVTLDISRIPFSRYGALLALFEPEPGMLTVQWAAKAFNDTIVSIEFFYEGKKVKPQFSTTPVCIKAVYEDAEAVFYIHSDSSIAIDSNGFDYEILPVRGQDEDCYGINHGENCFEMISFSRHFYASTKLFEGEGELYSPEVMESDDEMPQKDHKSELRIRKKHNKVQLVFKLSEEQMLFKNVELNVEQDLAEIEKEWLEFLDKMPQVREEHMNFAEYSWYNLWSSTIRKSRYIPYDVMLMSKKFMCAVWSWDHCFNAMALKESCQELAYQQFMLPYHFQSETGALPDLVSYNNEIYYGVTKPPIHGWAFRKIWKANPKFTTQELQNVYDVMSKQTKWWFDYRDSDGDGIPDYPQGCDSGVDNGSNFLPFGYYVESPDLPSYLILQMETLAELAEKLGRAEEEKYWKERSKKLLDDFLKHSLKDGEFVSKRSHTHEYNEESDNFLNLMPLLIGEYLDKEVVDRMIKRLKERHLTDYGIATESYKNKKYYTADGYWQGPVWAPSTYLLVDALKRLGEKELAKEIAEKYLHMVIDVAHGNYENFNALTGEGLRAPGYTWTAAVTLLLMRELYLGEFD